MIFSYTSSSIDLYPISVYNMDSDDLTIHEKISYIQNIVESLSIDERRDILQMIMNSSIDDKRIQTKGNGTQIPFKYIPENIIDNIYMYIIQRLAIKKEQLNTFPDDE